MTFADTMDKLSRPALSVELADRIRELIMEGELEEGCKVPERHLTERFGVSRTPLREAIKVLAHEGFVTLIPNRGAVVAPQSLQEVEELLPIVAALEGLAGELAAKRATSVQIDEISRLTKELRQAFTHRDRPTYFHINQTIHSAIIYAADNPTLLRNHTSLARRIYRARYQANLSEDRWKEATEEHEKIAEALTYRDSAVLGVLLREHLSHKLKSIRSALG